MMREVRNVRQISPGSPYRLICSWPRIPVVASALLCLLWCSAAWSLQMVGPKEPPVAAMQDESLKQAATPPAGKAPQVTYSGGQLTVVAENSSLAEVFAALRACMGTTVTLPAGAAGQRVWVTLGPGPARRILSDLLNSTDLNYVIQGSPTDPDGILSVELTPHAKSLPGEGAGRGTMQASRQGNRRGSSGDADAPEQPEQEAVAEVQPTVQPSPQPEPPPSSTPNTPATQPVQAQNAQPAASDLGPPTAVRSQDQMVQQLQSMYQQRKQIIANQQSPKPASPN